MSFSGRTRISDTHLRLFDRGARLDADDRAITVEDFAPINQRFALTIDVAASAKNARLERFCTAATDGLVRSWAGEGVWCNPPYSNIRPWVRKAWTEREAARVIVMLLPANRTEQSWWQELVEPFRDKPDGALSTEFLAGRLRFLRAGKNSVGPGERPPFGCLLLIWRP